MDGVEIFDTTLRDGEQSPGAAMSATARLRIAHLLDEARADTIEAGFPAASAVTARSVAQISAAVKNARVAALARCVQGDIDAAAAAVRAARRPRIHVFLATSDLHLEHKLRMTRERALEVTVEGVRSARRRCDDVEFSAEDATRSDPEFLARVFEAAIGAGATTINVPDTVGCTTPAEMERLIASLRRRVDGIDGVRVSVHTHDDLGMATANALAAVRAGARQVECTINGIGERAGNAALEEIVCALRAREDHYGATSGFDTTALAHLSRAVARAARMPVQRNKAIVGRNAFAHESGIHQDGILKHRSTYEIIDPATVGQKTTLRLGRNSGRHAVFRRARDLGLDVAAHDYDAFIEAFSNVAASQANVTDRDLTAIAARVANAEAWNFMKRR